MKTIKTFLFAGVLSASTLVTLPALAADYVIDTEGSHAFVQFRVKHLGYSWLYGRFNDFSGEFTYDKKNPEKNSISITLETDSVDTNHAERDKHIRSDDFLNVEKYPEAKFVSTGYKPTGDHKAQVTGNLTLHGVTKPITVDVVHVGGGKDPWGGYRDGFEGSVTIKPEEFGIPMAKKLGPASAEVEMTLSFEGIRQK